MGSALPRAVAEGVLRIGDALIPCAVLEDGRRVLTVKGVLQAMGRSKQKGGERARSMTDHIPPFLVAENLKPFVPSEIRRPTTLVYYKSKKGHALTGYAAEILPYTCRAYRAARRAGALQKNQLHVADALDILGDALMGVGIVALVDEATGFQQTREEDALQKLLAVYISPELLPHTSRFPVEFFKQIFRLRRWSWPAAIDGAPRGPRYIAHLINEVIYRRLPPGVLEALQAKLPLDEEGRRAAKLHQHLTREVADGQLKTLVTSTTALMRGCVDWGQFERTLGRAFPVPGQQNALPLPEE
jgi:hypothetical protein